MRTGSGLEHPTLDTIAAAYSAVVIERQMQLEQLFGEGGWSLDLQQNKLTIGARTLSVVPLAHADSAHDTWQWAWLSPQSPGAPADAHLLRLLIKTGQRFDVPELATGTIRLSGVRDGGNGAGHTLAVAACGLLAAHGYFPAPYDGGTAWLLVTDTRLGPVRPDARTASQVLAAATSMFPHANRLTVETYLGVHGLPAHDEGDRVSTRLGDDPMMFSFDETGRLRDITA